MGKHFENGISNNNPINFPVYVCLGEKMMAKVIRNSLSYFLMCHGTKKCLKWKKAKTSTSTLQLNALFVIPWLGVHLKSHNVYCFSFHDNFMHFWQNSIEFSIRFRINPGKCSSRTLKLNSWCSLLLVLLLAFSMTINRLPLLAGRLLPAVTFHSSHFNI